MNQENSDDFKAASLGNNSQEKATIYTDSVQLEFENEREVKRKFGCRAITSIFGAWTVLLMIGSQTSWGNQSTYVVSYYHSIGFQDVSLADFYIVQSLIVIVATFFFPLGMYFSEKYNVKLILAIGGFFMISSTFFSSRASSPTEFMLFYSGCFGIGKGLMYPAALSAAISHNPDRKGLISGCVICGFGMGGSFIGLITNRLVNPQNEAPEPVERNNTEVVDNLFSKEVAGEVPHAFFVISMIYLFISVFAVCTITKYEKKPMKKNQPGTNRENLLIYQLFEDNQRANQRQLTETEILELEIEKHVPMWKILMTRKFLTFFTLAPFYIFQGYYIQSSFKQIGFNGGIRDATLTFIGSISLFFAGVSKLIMASLLDYFAFKPIFLTMCTILMISLFTIHFVTHAPFFYGICVFLCLFCDASMAAILPVVTLNIFGQVRGYQVYSYLFAAFGVAAMSGALLVTTVEPKIGYSGMLWLCFAFVCTATVISIFYQFKRISYLLIFGASWDKSKTKIKLDNLKTKVKTQMQDLRQYN